MSHFPQCVLIVDDDPLQRCILNEFCCTQGSIHVDQAANGLEAAKALETARYSYELLILDLSMPERDGFELMDYLAEAGVKSALMFVSGMPQHIIEMSQSLAKSKDLNVIGHFSKPLDLKVISLAVECHNGSAVKHLRAS